MQNLALTTFQIFPISCINDL